MRNYLLQFVILFGCITSATAQELGTTCASAIPVICGITYSNNTSSIPNDNETSGADVCSSSVFGSQAWYSYSSSEQIAVVLSTCGSQFDTYLYLYSGSCGQNLLCLGQNDDNCGLQSVLTFLAEPGETYFIRVGGYGSAAGAFNLSVSCGDVVEGCMDPYASNYNPYAIIEDGSCIYLGCTDPNAPNYNSEATVDDGSCFEWTYGCTNPAASNYNPQANTDDGSCIVQGCTEPAAVNYNSSATEDDGSCQYCNGEGSVLASLYLCTFSNGNQVELQIVDENGNEVYYANGLNNGAIIYSSICLEPGVCYTANMINNTGPYGWYNGYFWVNVNGVQIINAQPNANAQFASVQFSIDGTCGPVFGCTDPTALNYNNEATMDDGSCQYPIAGCTDSTAVNFDPLASVDDGSCVVLSDCANNVLEFALYGGVFANEASYVITDAAGTVIASSQQGVMSEYACAGDGCYTIQMFDSFGDGWDGGGYLDVYANGALIGTFTLANGLSSGIAYFGVNAEGCTPSILGCTDVFALNYNPMATEDDGSCEYPEQCEQNLLSISVYTANWGSEISWSLIGADGVEYASGANYTSWGWYSDYACVPDGCYEVVMNDSWGDGWNGAYYMISSNTQYQEGSLFYGLSGSDLLAVNSECVQIAGCTDPDAINFDPQANYDNGSCYYNSGDGLGFDNGLEVEFSLFPNPTSAGIIVNASALDELKTLNINIFGAEGRLVRSVNVPLSSSILQLPIDCADLQAGYYLVQLVNGATQLVKPLIKQ